MEERSTTYDENRLITFGEYKSYFTRSSSLNFVDDTKEIFNYDNIELIDGVIDKYSYIISPIIGFGDVKDADLNLSPKGDLCEAAANLFAYMRIADSQNKYSKIAMSPIPETGLGLAINDRIRRAAYK